MHEVEKLSVPERIELRRLVSQCVPITHDLTDDDFAMIALESFGTLDAEEVPKVVPEGGEVVRATG